MAKEIRYGRGKFTHHKKYIDYQLMIANHPNYKDMPGALSKDGKPIWQVSSGKTTSFYEFYEARQKWWTDKADELRLPGKGKELDRWTLAARIIHPTGYRSCLICGEQKNIGYFYVNKRFEDRLTVLCESPVLKAPQPISDVIAYLGTILKEELVNTILTELFPERMQFFLENGVTKTAFEKSNYLKTAWLSPGFMGDPPYRFDGLHDYCTTCRKPNDPGRSDKNMATYSHDRRAFKWWAEGNWALADALYNSAGPGLCVLCTPPRSVDKVSPDHVGPLACGFKHIPFFRPVCRQCNSSKNRRLTLQDVKDLIDYEKRTGESPASWQVRDLWDYFKIRVLTASDAKKLSALMRAMQDLYLRTLYALYHAGFVHFLSTLLHPEYSLRKYSFADLDSGSLTFSKIRETVEDTKGRRSLAARVVRIAFDELDEYARKAIGDRRVRQIFTDDHPEVIPTIVDYANKLPTAIANRAWRRALLGRFPNDDAREAAIYSLLAARDFKPIRATPAEEHLKSFIQDQFSALARSASN